MPEFSTAHLLIAGGFVAIAVSTDVTLALLCEASALRVFAMSIGAIGLSILGTLNFGRMKRVSTLLWVALIVLFCAVPNPDESLLLKRLVADPLFQATFGCLGLAAMVAAGRQLIRLSEDSPGYDALDDGVDWDRPIGYPTSRRQQELTKKAASFPPNRTRRDILFNLAFRHMPRPGRWRRAVLRQVVEGAVVLWVLPMQTLVLLMFLWTGNKGSDLLHDGDRFLVCFVPFLVAIGLSSNSWTIRRDHLARESLLPVGRKDFVRDMARATAFEMWVAAAGHCLVIVAALALFASEMPNAGFIGAWLALTVAQYFVGFSLMSWLNAYSPSCGSVVAMGVVCFAMPGMTAAVLAGANQGDSLFGGTVTLLGVAAIAAISFGRLAWYEWRQIDFD
ncbi:MAG TPA: hypothetical protein DD670_12950 [Planctomycetaceae bacterium]|nr:hypothetical protein [Planctomycetaceae bacterium]